MTKRSHGFTVPRWAAIATTLLGAFLASFVAVKMVAAFTGPSQGPPNGSGAISVSGSNVGIGGNLNVTGTITGNYTGDIAAGNVSAGAFGANTGGGNYSFPGSLGVGTASPGAKLDVAGGINLEANGTNDAALQVGYTSASPAGYYATYAP